VHPDIDETAEDSPNVPEGQSLQEEEAFADALYVPAAHAVHTPSRVAEKYPPEQAIGAFAGFRHEYPAGQGAQDCEPVAFAYMPVGQRAQDEAPPVEYDPAAQRLIPALQTYPAGQVAQYVAPAEE
jgi:hypothetical protein